MRVSVLHKHLIKGFSSSTEVGRYGRMALLVLLAALLITPFADLAVSSTSPGEIVAQIAWGLLTPTLPTELSRWSMLDSVLTTIAIAMLAVALAMTLGFVGALVAHLKIVRVLAASIRAVHELFWGLLLMQLFGMTPQTALLAIAIPFTGMFIRVFRDILESVDQRPYAALPIDTDRISRWAYVRISQSWPQLKETVRYRFECALRASAVLGFLGLPTLGFHLETAFRQGYYSEAATWLYLFFLLIATIRWWMRPALLCLYAPLLAYWLQSLPVTVFDAELLWRFLSDDIVPAPLRNSSQGSIDGVEGSFVIWLTQIISGSIVPGVTNTLLLSLLALPLTALLALLWFPLTSPLFVPRHWQPIGRGVLIVLRSVPEYILAFVALLVLGLSWLPALFALSVHNAAVIAQLLGPYTQLTKLRDDAARGVNAYFYEVLPRISEPFMLFLLYRWEIILRESAILGILGIHTLGFYIDSSFAEMRFDRAVLLIAAAALLNIAVDLLVLKLRTRMHRSAAFTAC